MSARRILTTDMDKLVPSSEAGRSKLPERRSLPNNTISFEQLRELAPRIADPDIDAGELLKELISRLPRDR